MNPRQAQRLEELASAELWQRRLALGAALVALAEHENSRLSLAGWTRKVTSYKNREGRQVRGFLDFRDPRLSAERIEKSTADAEWWLEQLEGGRVVSDEG